MGCQQRALLLLNLRYFIAEQSCPRPFFSQFPLPPAFALALNCRLALTLMVHKSLVLKGGPQSSSSSGKLSAMQNPRPNPVKAESAYADETGSLEDSFQRQL